MTFSNWISWVLSVIVTAVEWLKKAPLLGAPLLYILLAIIVMGVVVRAVLFRA